MYTEYKGWKLNTYLQVNGKWVIIAKKQKGNKIRLFNKEDINKDNLLKQVKLLIDEEHYE